jgi:signal transduction histidine kinase
MKITPSIRLFVLLSMLISGIAMIWGLSVLSSNYFISGIDIGTRNGMFAFAHQEQNNKHDRELTFITSPEADKVSKTVTYKLVRSWDNVPEIFQQTFKPDELQFNKLYKHFVETSIFTPPEVASFIMKIMKNNEVHYVTLIASKNGFVFQGITNLNHFTVITVTALAVITLFSIILLFVMRQITLPVTRLKNWAKYLTNKELSQPIPNFHYSELNTLAKLIKNSVSSVQESVEREKIFLGYASHELRTPIATSRSNAELLHKLIENKAPIEKQLNVLDRVLRANLTMTDLTETLLWLNRSEGKGIIAQQFSVGSLIEQLSSELKYLIVDKAITVNVETDDSVFELPESVCRIIIANLIRNAFQHTVEGYVTIRQIGYRLSIVNQNNVDIETNDILKSDNLGFGLGLSLTERIIQQYQWQYSSIDIVGGKDVSVIFEET